MNKWNKGKITLGDSITCNCYRKSKVVLQEKRELFICLCLLYLSIHFNFDIKPCHLFSHIYKFFESELKSTLGQRPDEFE